MAKYVKRTCTLPIDVELITCERCRTEHALVPAEINRTQTEGVQLVVPPTPAGWIQVGRNKLCGTCAISFNKWLAKAASDTTPLELKLKRIGEIAQVFVDFIETDMPGMEGVEQAKNELLNAIVEARGLIP